MELSKAGGLSETIKKIVATKDVPQVMAMFKEIILKSYGEKSPDGRRFIKSEQLATEFTQTGAYDILMMELIGDPEKAANFINSIIPAELREEVEKQQKVAPKE